MFNKSAAPRGFGSFLGVFMLGTTAGAVAALLMAPRSGRETRAQLKSAALGLKRKVERAPAAIRAAGDRTLKTGVAAYEEARDEVTRRADKV
ncbi:MAG TPA: YtxH domain-containing protein [Verrucomicrobiae bacterium]|nr:YtxH domain-containing protein [Verrucomicrobiae bacterium]